MMKGGELEDMQMEKESSRERWFDIFIWPLCRRRRVVEKIKYFSFSRIWKKLIERWDGGGGGLKPKAAWRSRSLCIILVASYLR